jgi:hypothetical protein
VEENLKIPGLAFASAQYRVALDESPNFAQVHYDLGVALEQTGPMSEAMAEYL